MAKWVYYGICVHAVSRVYAHLYIDPFGGYPRSGQYGQIPEIPVFDQIWLNGYITVYAYTALEVNTRYMCTGT